MAKNLNDVYLLRYKRGSPEVAKKYNAKAILTSNV